MNTTTIVLIIIVIVGVIMAVAWLLYKSGFKVKEVSGKAGLLEVKMERPTDQKKGAKSATSRSQASQEARRGGRIKNADIKAPADAGATLSQKADGKGSSIRDSNIELS